MDDNVLQKVKKALQELSVFLDNPAVKTALNAIPASIKGPVIDGLKRVLGVIKDALKELKDKLGSITSLKDLLTTINSLLEAAEGLAPGQKDTIETVKNIVKTLQDLPDVAEIEAILTLIDQIVAKL